MWVSQSPTPSNLPLCKYFFSLGVDFSLINENGQGCLHKAAQRGNMDLCKWLLTEVNLSIEHFKPNAAEKSTPSQLAFFAGHELLNKYLADVERTKNKNNEH